MDAREIQDLPEFQGLFKDAAPVLIGDVRKHVLSHQNIYARFYKLDVENVELVKKSFWNYFLLEKLDTLAKHKLISSFVEHYF